MTLLLCRCVGDLLESVDSVAVATAWEFVTEPFEPSDSVLLLVLLVRSPPAKDKHKHNQTCLSAVPSL